MKWLGILLVLLTGIGAGMIAWFRLQRRVEILSRCSVLIERASERIRYSAQPLGNLLEELLPKTVEQGEDPRAGLLTAIDEHGGEWGLFADDCALLRGFADGIGRSDVDGELRHCGEYRKAIDDHLQQAREELRVKGRLFMTVGVCGGLLTALLLW